MSFDDLFIAIIIAGIGLSVACLCARYRERRISRWRTIENRRYESATISGITTQPNAGSLTVEPHIRENTQ